MADRLGRRPVMWASMGFRGLNFVALFLAWSWAAGTSWPSPACCSCHRSSARCSSRPRNAMVADIVGPGRRMEAYSSAAGRAEHRLDPRSADLGPLIVFLPFSSLFAGRRGHQHHRGRGHLLSRSPNPARSPVHERFHPRDLLNIWHNKLFLVFCLASLPLAIVLGQMSSTFSVFSVEDVGIAEAEVGYLYALNGADGGGATVPHGPVHRPLPHVLRPGRPGR